MYLQELKSLGDVAADYAVGEGQGRLSAVGEPRARVGWQYAAIRRRLPTGVFYTPP